MEFAGVKRWKVMVFTEALELFELGGSGSMRIHTLQWREFCRAANCWHCRLPNSYPSSQRTNAGQLHGQGFLESGYITGVFKLIMGQFFWSFIVITQEPCKDISITNH